MLIELERPIPVIVTSKGNAKGVAHFLLDYGPEYHVLWQVFMDETGESWWVPNPEIRQQRNWSMQRRDYTELKYGVGG